MADDTPGARLFLIRAACGNGTRAPMPLKAFAALVFERTGVSYDPTTLSLLERNVQKWRTDDIRTLSSVDPKERGRIWLSALEIDVQPAAEADAEAEAPPSTHDTKSGFPPLPQKSVEVAPTVHQRRENRGRGK